MDSLQLVFFLLLFANCSAGAEGPGAEKSLPHPFLFFSSDDVPRLRRLAEGAGSATAQRIHAAAQLMVDRPDDYLPPSDPALYGARWNERFGNNIVPLAMHCVLRPTDKKAFDLLLKYADRMVKAPSWYVKSLPRDEVPVSHSLVGLITAMDFVYERLSIRRRQAYFNVIFSHAKTFYRKTTWSRRPAWITMFVHNHSPTILLSMFMAALVSERHGVKDATLWRKTAEIGMAYNLEILRLVVDGSLNEGVTYGSYTTRSLTQYAVLGKRHQLLREDLTQHPWFKRHLDFLVFTILPGYQQTIGIGDSSPTWFYGPESQLLFLDSFVLRNGEAKWLAEQIREKRVDRGPLVQGRSQVWSTLHTELIWMDAEHGSERPETSHKSLLHVFSDWGVATYGGGTPTGHTFLSLKCSMIHGKAANSLASRNISWLRGWKSFNPGHEQPDQGSFTFYPRGHPVITEALYGPKLSSLNNVLLFGPSQGSPCAAPLEGQAGECGKWLNYQLKEAREMSADIITASEEDGLVFMAGEYAKAYHPRLQLASVVRATLLLTPTVLLVLDSIATLKRPNAVRTASAFFHNIHTAFQVTDGNQAHIGQEGVSPYTIHWLTEHNGMVRALADNATFPAEAGKRKTNFLNATFDLGAPGSYTRIVWLFAPSELHVDMKFLTVQPEGVTVSVQVGSQEFSASISTLHEDVERRLAWLGSAGFAHVTTSDRLYRFGIGTSTLSQANSVFSKDVSEKTMANIHLAVSVLTLAAVIFMLLFVVRRQRHTHLYKCFLNVFLVWALFLAVSLFTLYPDSSGDKIEESGLEQRPRAELLPNILVSGLSMSGTEILHDAFSHSPDLLSMDLNDLPKAALEPHHLELDQFNSIAACPWTREDASRERFPLTAGWMKTLMSSPAQYFHDLLEYLPKTDARPPSANWINENKNKKKCSVLLDKTGVWNARHDWVQGLLGSAARSVLLVRDPRSWVAEKLSQPQKSRQIKNLIKSTRDTMRLLSQTPCHNSSAFKELSNILYSSSKSILEEPTRFLAALWYLNTHLSLSSTQATLNQPTPEQFILRHEDLLNNTQTTAEKLFRWLRLPLRPAVIHRLLSLLHTERIPIKPYGTIRVREELELWKRQPLAVIYTIQDVCAPIMTQLGYRLEE